MNKSKNASLLGFFIIFIFIIGSFALGFITQFYNIELKVFDRIIIPQFIFVALPVTIYFMVTKAKFKDTIRFKKVDFTTIFLTFCMTIFIIPVIGFINSISMLFVRNHVADTLMEAANAPLILSLLFTAVLPAINEEIFSRGILLSAYRKENILKGILLSSLFFGIMHLNINQFLYAFFIGCVFSLLVEATGSIIPAMISHFTINANATILLWLSGQLPKWLDKLSERFPELKESLEQSYQTSLEPQIPSLMDTLIIIFVVFIIACVAGLIAYLLFNQIVRRNKTTEHVKNIFRKNTPVETESDEVLKPVKLMTWPVYAAIVLFIAFSVYAEVIYYIR